MCIDHNHEALTDASLFVDPEMLRKGAERGCVWMPDVPDLRTLLATGAIDAAFGAVLPGSGDPPVPNTRRLPVELGRTPSPAGRPAARRSTTRCSGSARSPRPTPPCR